MQGLVRLNKKNGVLTLRALGQLDAAAAERLAAEMLEIVRGGEYHIILDLSEVSYISSAGIRFLLKTRQALEKLRGAFRVAQPSLAARSVLALCKLEELIVKGTADDLSPASGGAAARETRIGAARYAVYDTSPGAALECRITGDPARLEQAGFDPNGAESLAIGGDGLALGVGRLQQSGFESGAAFGEFVAAGGTAAAMPAAGAPDYLLASNEMQPGVRALYGAVCRGNFAKCVRFEPSGGDGRESLSGLAAAALDLAGADAIGMVALAESAGLIGAALKRDPAAARDQSIFAHPAIRDWLDFSPERIYDRCSVLIAGIALRGDAGGLAAFVRPLAGPPAPAGHFHAAVFTYKALPGGALPLGRTLLSLYEDEKLLAVLHLLNDRRDLDGGGESVFLRGVAWLGPLRTATGRSTGDNNQPRSKSTEGE